MSLLSTWKAAQIEEHLLICEACRRTAAAAEVYIAAMRMAAAKCGIRRSAKALE